MLRTSDSIKAISTALLAFQGRVTGVAKDSENAAFKSGGKASKYASLESVRETIGEALQSCGVAFLQSAGSITDGVMEMSTRLIHAETGEWIEGVMQIPLGKRDPQGAGSAQTYAQRYHLMAMLGLPPVDDDGEAAIDRNNDRPAPPVAVATKSSAQAKRDGDWEALTQEVDACMGLEDLEVLVASSQFRETAAKMPPKWKDELRDYVTNARNGWKRMPTARASLDRQFGART
jgi:hypothetical protein